MTDRVGEFLSVAGAIAITTVVLAWVLWEEWRWQGAESEYDADPCAPDDSGSDSWTI